MTLTPEMQVVVTASKGVLERRDLDELAAILSVDIDWDTLLLQAEQHKVFPRVWPNLSHNFSQYIPAEIYEHQKELLRSRFFSCALMSKNLVQLLEILYENNVVSMPYKGPVLAQYLYGDLALRSYGDLDLLIYRDDFPKVYQILLDNGYKPEFKIAVEQLAFYSRAEDNFCFVSKRGVSVEIHWELSGRYLRRPFDITQVIMDVGYIELLGKKLPVFSDENLLIYFSLHGTKHCWEQLDLVSGVAEILVKADIDWHSVREKALDYKCKRMLFVGLHLAQQLYKIKLPQDIIDEIQGDEKAIRLSCELLQTFYYSDRHSLKGRLSAEPNYSLLRFTIRDSGVDIFFYILRLMFVPSKAEWKALPLPSAFAWMYCIVRPCRVICASTFGILRQKWHRL